MLSPIEQLRRLTLPQQAAIGILRHAIYPDDHHSKPDTNILRRFTESDWEELHRFAARQGFAALAFEALMPLAPEIHIPYKLKLSWGMSTDTAIRKYRYFCRTAPEFENFFAKAGFIPVHMKGLALSLLYPRPELRECGDYDFYLLREGENPESQDLITTSTQGESLALAAGIDIDTSYSKHSSFHFKGIDVECHRFFLSTNFAKSAPPVERILHKHIAPQTATLPTGEQIHIVSPEFSKIFVPYHAMQHTGSGLRLRHIADWAMICRAYGDDLPGKGYSETLTQGAASLSAISNLLLGSHIAADDNPELTSLMLHAILNPGRYEYHNPHHKRFIKDINLLIRFTRRHPLTSRVFPGEGSYFAKLFAILKRRAKKIFTKSTKE
ncbi:MAG: nucleotidyltransferase family protein [Bacteroides sp.]|nr:nucleotidyltransferase family protein [Bacteroides sp.]